MIVKGPCISDTSEVTDFIIKVNDYSFWKKDITLDFDIFRNNILTAHQSNKLLIEPYGAPLDMVKCQINNLRNVRTM